MAESKSSAARNDDDDDEKEAAKAERDEGSDSDDDVFVDAIAKLKAAFGDACEESATLARFVRANAASFAGCDGADLLTREHALEHHELHRRYLRAWEQETERFLRDEGLSAAELQTQFHDALVDRYTALFEEHAHHGYVDSALAALSFDHFFRRMCDAAAAEAKGDDLTPRQRRRWSS